MIEQNRLIELSNIVYDIIGAGMEVHNELGYGISEGVYEEALGIELSELGYEYLSQCELPVFYKGQLLEKRFRMDMVVENDVIIELKAVDTIQPEHRAQLFNYLRLTQKPIGLLLNFGKSFYAEKYLYNPETNEISFLNKKNIPNDSGNC